MGLILPTLFSHSLFFFSTKPDTVWYFQNDTFSLSLDADVKMDADSNIYFISVMGNTIPDDPTICAKCLDIDFSAKKALLQGKSTRLIKYNKHFELLWVKSFEQQFYAEIAEIDGKDIYLTGIFRDTVDFDPDPNNSEIMYSSNKVSRYLLKMDTSGHFQKKALFLNPQRYQYIVNYKSMRVWVGPDKSLYLHSIVEDSFDVDPGPATVMAGHYTYEFLKTKTAMVIHLNPNFQYLGHLDIANDSLNFALSFVDGKIIANGTQTRDIKPSVKQPNITIPFTGNRRWIFIEYDLSLNYLKYTEPYQTTGTKWGQDIIQAPDGSTYLFANFYDSISLIPGNDSFNFYSAGMHDFLIIKVNNLMDFKPLASYHVGDIGSEFAFFIDFIHGDELLLHISMSSGLSGINAPSPDFDPGPDTIRVDKRAGFGDAILRLSNQLEYRGVGSYITLIGDYYTPVMLSMNDTTLFILGGLMKQSVVDLDLSWNEEAYNLVGSYVRRLLFMTYTFPSPSSYSYQDTICQGDSLKFKYDYLTSSNIYKAAYAGANYRDSVVELNLNVSPTYAFQLKEDTLCYGGTHTWRGKKYTESGIYYDSLKTTYGCDSVYSAILPFSKVDTTLKQINNLLIAPQFQKTYTWFDCYDNYAPIPGITVNAYTPPKGGIYGVILENSFGCFDTSRCVEIRYTGLEDATSPEINVYPNPFTDHITIEGLEIGEEITIYNALGVLVYSGVAEGTKTEITMENINMHSGVYMLLVSNRQLIIVRE